MAQEWKKPEDVDVPLPPPKSLVWVVLGILVVAIGWASVYTVQPDSVGVVLRFGRYVRESQPGLRFKFPLGVERVRIVPVRRQLKLEFGFSTLGAANLSQASREADLEKRMVTGDLNAALVEWVIQYRISNPTDFLFKVRRPEDTVRAISESVMREVVGDRTVDEVITIGRQEIESQGLLKMQDLAGKYEVGIGIDQVQLKDVDPPRPVQDSFNAVNQAQQEKETLINEARREYNRAIPLAEGMKDQKIQEAEGYRLKRTNEADGDVARFNSVLAEYLKAPKVTKRRLYLETMQEVLPAMRSKILIDESARSVLPLLQIDTEKGARP